MRRRVLACLLCLGASASVTGAAQAQIPTNLSTAQWQQRLGTALPLRARFEDSSGHPVQLGAHFGAHPVAIVFMYLNCPQLCPMTLQLARQAFERAGLVPGKDFELLALSIDARDTPAAAARREAALTDRHGHALHVLTAPEAGQILATSTAQVAQAAGFGYFYDPRSRQFAHPAGFVLADAQGRVQQYFFGLQYDPRALRAAVQNARESGRPRWSTPLRLLCYCLGITNGRYTHDVVWGVRIGCLTALLLGGALAWRTLRPPDGSAGAAGPSRGPQAPGRGS